MRIRLWRAASAVRHADNTLFPYATRPPQKAPGTFRPPSQMVYAMFTSHSLAYTPRRAILTIHGTLGLVLSATFFCSSTNVTAAVGQQLPPRACRTSRACMLSEQGLDLCLVANDRQKAELPSSSARCFCGDDRRHGCPGTPCLLRVYDKRDLRTKETV